MNQSRRRVKNDQFPEYAVSGCTGGCWLYNVGMETDGKPPACCRVPFLERQHGFTLTEWLIIVAVLGILAATIYPAYKNYTIRPKFSEVMVTIAPYKAAIETCAKNGTCVVDGSLSGLGVGKLGLPPAFSTTYMARVAVSPNGVITAIASNKGGLAGETFILTPSLSKNAQITWAVSGTCKTREAGAIC